MPYATRETQTSAGLPVLRVDISGALSGAEARELVATSGPGAKYETWSQLNVFAPGASVSPEARAIYGSLTPESTPAGVRVGLVLDSAVLRTTINFILKVNRNHKVHVFRAESDALAWIDAELGAARP